MSLTILLPAMIIGYSVYKLNKNALENYVQVRLGQEGERGAGIIENFFSSLERKISLINLLTGAEGLKKERVLPFLMDIINNFPEISGIKVTQSSGKTISFGRTVNLYGTKTGRTAYIGFPEEGKLTFVFSYPLPRLGGTVSGSGDLKPVLERLEKTNSLPEDIIKLSANGKTVFETGRASCRESV